MFFCYQQAIAGFELGGRHHDRAYRGRIALALGVLLVLMQAAAQQTGRVFHIGLLSAGSPEFYARELVDREGMRAFGYEEGRNPTLSAHYANGDYAKPPSAHPGARSRVIE